MGPIDFPSERRILGFLAVLALVFFGLGYGVRACVGPISVHVERSSR